MRSKERTTAITGTTRKGSEASFGQKHRLTEKSSFDRVFRKAARSRDELFIVLCRPNGREEARLGLAIGRRHCRSASGRNRQKRIVRESFRHHKAQLAGLDIVVINQAGATRAANTALFASLENHWQRCAGTRPDGIT